MAHVPPTFSVVGDTNLRGTILRSSPYTYSDFFSPFSARLRKQDVWFLIVEGSAKRLPFLAGWQEFKDRVRRSLHYQPGRVDVYGDAGQRQVWLHVPIKEDAFAIFGTRICVL